MHISFCKLKLQKIICIALICRLAHLSQESHANFQHNSVVVGIHSLLAPIRGGNNYPASHFGQELLKVLINNNPPFLYRGVDGHANCFNSW